MLLSNITTRRKAFAMLSYLLAALAGAVGQLCFKILAKSMGDVTLPQTLMSPGLHIGIASYFSVMGFFVVGLRLWGELSTLYPIYGTTFIWAILIAAIWLGEPISITGVAGTAIIIAGIRLLNNSHSASRKGENQ